MGSSLKLGTKVWLGNSKWKTFQIISEFMVLWRVAYYSYVRVGKKIHLLISLLYILSNITHVTWNLGTSRTSLLCAQQCKIIFDWLQVKLGYVFQEKSWIKVLLNGWCRCVKLHMSTLAQKHRGIFLYLLWDRLGVGSIASVHWGYNHYLSCYQ